MTSAPPITVASYNMRKAIGTDRKRNPLRVLEVLRRDRRRHRRAAGSRQARRHPRRRGAAPDDRRSWLLPRDRFQRHPSQAVRPAARRLHRPHPRPSAGRAIEAARFPQPRLARQCDPGEAPRRGHRLRSDRIAQYRAARRGHGRAVGARRGAAGDRHAPRFERASAAAAGAQDPRSYRAAAPGHADRRHGRHQRMAAARRQPGRVRRAVRDRQMRHELPQPQAGRGARPDHRRPPLLDPRGRACTAARRRRPRRTICRSGRGLRSSRRSSCAVGAAGSRSRCPSPRDI